MIQLNYSISLMYLIILIIQLFEKCGEDFTNIKVDHIINPFPDEDPNHQHMRISEESEELFDK